ncbi:MAG TPA: hypothetical protein VFI29_04165 [Hanamia sp.]|nr:hypothetical protein [Hanamia sp.]
MKYLRVIPLIVLTASCATKSSPQYDDGWHKAFIEIDNGNTEGAMVGTKDGLVDTICFSSGKCVGHFTQWTTFEHSQNVSGKDNNNIYTVYIIPDEWDQSKELFQHKEDEQ